MCVGGSQFSCDIPIKMARVDKVRVLLSNGSGCAATETVQSKMHCNLTIVETRGGGGYANCLYMDLDGSRKDQSLLIYPPRGLRDSYDPKIKRNLSNLEKTFLENPLFVLWLTLIIDLVDPGHFLEMFN